ncbi:DAHL domain-containing protein [Pseudoduganella sp. HUAS MS19]
MRGALQWGNGPLSAPVVAAPAKAIWRGLGARHLPCPRWITAQLRYGRRRPARTPWAQAHDDLEKLLAPTTREIGRELLLDSLEFTVNGDVNEEKEIEAGVSQLKAAGAALSASAQQRLAIFLAHVRTVGREYRAVRDILQEFDAVPVTAELDQAAALLATYHSWCNAANLN